MVNPRVSHPPVTIDMGGFFTTQSWIQMGLPAMICRKPTGCSLASRTCRSTWSLSLGAYLCRLFFWRFPWWNPSSSLDAWFPGKMSLTWMTGGTQYDNSRLNMMKLDEAQDIGTRSSSSWWGRTSLCFVFNHLARPDNWWVLEVWSMLKFPQWWPFYMPIMVYYKIL